MKNLLVTVFLLLVSTGAMAQEQSLRECRVLAADEWITMGVTSIAGCMKYAEAAVTPDEAQYAQFGGVSLMIRDGQYFQSNDGGQAWKRFQPFNSRPGVSTLNALQSPAEDEEKAAPVEQARPVEKSEPKEVVTQVPAPVAPERRNVRSQPVARAPSVPAEVSAPPDVPIPAPSVPPRAASAGESSRPDLGASGRQALACQIRITNRWQVAETDTLERCAEVTYARMGRAGQAEAQAYWGGTYLVVSQSKIFKSNNGKDWAPLKE